MEKRLKAIAIVVITGMAATLRQAPAAASPPPVTGPDLRAGGARAGPRTAWR
jgi:hypothetical protein